MRSVWKGAISFGLVNIPVAVYPATREEKMSFKQLRKKDLSPVRYKKVAEADNKEVPSDEIVKGYEFEKGKWVVLEEADFDSVEIASTHTIEITDFVAADDVNPKFFHKPYFLEPQKGGEKAYALLHRALVETGQMGIAKVAIRSREYLAGIKVDGLFIMLELMHFAQEIVSPDELKTPFGMDLSAKEIQMAKALIDSLSGDFEPEKYADRYQDALREMIERKVKQLPPGKAGTAPRSTGASVDLLAALQESIRESADRRKRPAAIKGRSTAALVKGKRAAGLQHN